mmetsp:Transcript_106212/g.310486  ORF Transcript_106212/g.310486 Transcript_106212/m.310486 type:complete len:386 (+) Transcript_106212:97-1254(+)
MAEADHETNTVHVVLPPGASLRSATDALKRFGDVSHVEVLPGKSLAVSAVFFDVRAAARARSTLGPECCQPAAQTGCRSVRLQGNIQLDVEKIRGVSRVLPEPSEDGSFLVEFFDVRDAQRAMELTGQSSGKLGACNSNTSAEAVVKGSSEPATISVPAYVKPSHGFVAPAGAGSGCSLSQQACVLLKGLPKALCTNDCLEAMFEQAGFEGSIVSCRVRRGAAHSEVLVSFSSRQMARRCLQHFHGRCWTPGAAPVSATFARVGGRGGDAALDRPLFAPQKAPLPEDAEAEAAEAEAWTVTTSTTTPSQPLSPLPECEAPPGLCTPAQRAAELALAEAKHKLEAEGKEGRALSLATDESTADGASSTSDQEEVEPLATGAAAVAA